MRVQISVTTETGAVYTGEVELSSVAKERRVSKASAAPSPNLSDAEKIDFGLPVRPFVKKYANGLSGGPKRLTLLIARIAEGEGSVQVPRAQLVKQWSKMTSLMGGEFNSAYETRARDNGWISSPKAGVYELLPAWKEIFS